MSSSSIRLLNSTDGYTNVVGDKTKAAGYFGSSSGIHTIAADLQNFTGRIYVEASLATEPQESDWFSIQLDGTNDYIEFSGDTAVKSYTFKGNYVWLRARQNRDYLPDPEASGLGHIEKILLNY